VVPSRDSLTLSVSAAIAVGSDGSDGGDGGEPDKGTAPGADGNGLCTESQNDQVIKRLIKQQGRPRRMKR